MNTPIEKSLPEGLRQYNESQRTPQQASLDSRPAREAWERGETIEVRIDYPEYGPTRDYTLFDPSELPDFINTGCHWRVAKPRVETKWRPWRPEEVPLGWEVCRKDRHNYRELITSSDSPSYWFTKFDLLLPDGTYAPCGVEEEVG